MHVVWSAQFHDVAGQAIGAGDTTKVPDLLIQPLAMAAMVEVLLDVASGGRNGDLVGVTGRRTQLAAISAAFARHEGADAQVITAPVGDAIRDGILLPGPDAVLVGPTFDEWLAARNRA